MLKVTIVAGIVKWKKEPAIPSIKRE